MVFMQGSAYLIPLLINPYVSGIFNPAGMGIISFSNTIITYFIMLTMLGIPTYGMRECSKHRDDDIQFSKTSWELFFLNCLILVCTVCLFLISLRHSKLAANKDVLVCMLPALLLNVLSFDWLYKAKEEFVLIGMRNFGVKVLCLVLIFLLVKEPEDLKTYAVLLVLASYGYGILNFVAVFKQIKVRGIGTLNLSKHVKPVIFFFAITVAGTIYTNLDTVMIGFLRGDFETGIYDAALKLKVLLAVAVCSLSSILLPRSTALFTSGNRGEFEKLCSKSFNFTLLMGIGGCAFCFLFAKPLILLFSGEKFLAAVPVLRVLSFTSLFLACTSVIGMQILIPTGKENVVLWGGVAGALVDLILNFILIPRIGIIGAAWGTVCAECVVFLVQFLNSREYSVQLFKNVRYIFSLRFYLN